MVSQLHHLNNSYEKNPSTASSQLPGSYVAGAGKFTRFLNTANGFTTNSEVGRVSQSQTRGVAASKGGRVMDKTVFMHVAETLQRGNIITLDKQSRHLSYFNNSVLPNITRI